MFIMEQSKQQLQPCTDIFHGRRVLVVGLGKTGLSCVRFFAERGVDVAVTDSRDKPAELEKLKDQYPDVAVFVGGLNEQAINSADVLIVSPGIPIRTPSIAAAIMQNKLVMGDIEVFAQCTRKPVVAITGSNGKSTVTTLLGDMARVAKRRAVVAGNIGLPVLETIDDDEQTDLYILELSSFQLETTSTLKPVAAVILNITEDHMDRYSSFAEYQAAKARIYRGAQAVIVNRDELAVSQLLNDWYEVPQSYSYSTTLAATQVDFAIIQHQSQPWLAKAGTPLIPVSALKIKGNHNVSNVLAALALGTAIDLPLPAMLEAIQQFAGLPHRTQWVAEQNGVVWFNDSKATNVGATLAAVKGLAVYRLILLMGGQGKGQDFTMLRDAFTENVKHVFLFGEDAQHIADALGDVVQHTRVKDLKQAVNEAQAMAVQGDAVLLSPACASFDMFKGYDHRGQVFTQLVHEVLA